MAKQTRSTLIRWILTASTGLTLAFVGCNKTTKTDEAAPEGPVQEKLTAASYPHKKNFLLQHGERYLANKTECLSCHDSNGTIAANGGNTGVSCTSCHNSFPHARSWAAPGQHAEAFKKEPQSCALCHGGDLKGGKSQVSCLACHPSFPHPSKWSQTANHGKAYLEAKDKTAACFTCHDSNGSGAGSSPGGTAGTAATGAAGGKNSCTSCHNSFPHIKDWAQPTQHAEAYKKEPQSCAVCHGSDWKGGTSQVSCLTCHPSFPHPSKWAQPVNHGKAYVEAKNKTAACFGCHDPKKDVTAAATRCDGCHKVFPHPKGFANGSKLHASMAQSYEGKCTNCHRNFKENMPENADSGGCMSCHEDKTLKIQWIDNPPPAPAPGTPPAPKDGERAPSSSSGSGSDDQAKKAKIEK